MAVVRLAGFMGAAQAPHPKLLPETVGVSSVNQKTGRGDLRPLKAPAAVATVLAGKHSIYRMGRDTPSDSNYWLSWAEDDVCVVRGYDSTDQGERTYYSGNGTFPKWTDTAKALAGDPPTSWRPLGVPAPSSKPTVATSGGTSTTLEDRFYCYTYVTDAGEESAPSPPSDEITVKIDATVTISAFAAPPSGNYGITLIRIYRTQAGSSGTADFYFLREIAVATTTTTDDGRALAEVLPTTTWLPAPGVPQGGAANFTEDPLVSLVPLWNGMLAGISGRGIRFCEPFTAYAWPIDYELKPADVTPLKLGSFGQTLVCVTNGRPVIVTGGSPDAMDEQPVDWVQACVSKRSVVSTGSGVAWASPDGLAYVGTDGSKLLTAGILHRDDWQALVPSTILGAMFEGRYYGFYTVGGVQKGFYLEPGNPVGMYFLDFGCDAVYVDDLQDAMYLLQGTSIKKWEGGAALTATFRSKVFQLAEVMPSFGWAKVVADIYPVGFKLLVNGAQVHSQNVGDSTPFRLPSGYVADNVQIELTATGPVQFAAVAHSQDELAGAP